MSAATEAIIVMPQTRFAPQAGFLASLLLFLLLLGGAVAYFVNHQKNEQIAAQLQLNEMRSRMFEYQVTRTFGLTEQTLPTASTKTASPVN